MMIVEVRTELAASADKVWPLLKRKETLLYVTRGLLGLPESKRWPATWRVGDEVRSRLVIAHLVPAWEHRIRVIAVDDDRMELTTQERGGPIETWNHRLRVEPLPDGRSRYLDRIEIRAGRLTPVVWGVANLFYRYRQARWRALARVIG